MDATLDDAPTDEGARRAAPYRAPASMRLPTSCATEEGAARVGVHHEVVVGFGHVGQALRGADARVVDQDVQRADLGLGVGYTAADVVPRRSRVQHHHMGIAAVALDPGPQVLPAASTRRPGQHHAGAWSESVLSELGAQAAGGAGLKDQPRLLALGD